MEFQVNVNNSNRQWEHSIATAKLNPFNTSGSNTDKKTIVKNLKFEASPEIEVNTQADPMDVDDDEYDYNLHAKPYTTYEARRLNTKSIPLKRKCDKSKTNSSTYLLGSLIVVLLCYIIFHLNLFEESKLEPPQHIINDLENILHQDHVKDITSRSLNNLGKTNSKKILAFVGSTGVGKTYTVNLIKKYFSKDHVIDLSFALQNYHNIISKLSADGCYFIIIDNLKINDLESVTLLMNTLPDKCMLIVPIFNIHDIDDNLVYTTNFNHYKRIRDKFQGEFPKTADVVLFNNINRDIIEKWLKNQIRERGLTHKEEEIFSLLEDYDVEVHGFKGLLPKINVLAL